MEQNTSDGCTTCKKTPPDVKLKNCAKCRTTPYCSRDCQKANWKVQKKICGKQEGKQNPPSSSSDFDNAPRASIALSPPKGLDGPITKPFTRLHNRTWLHDRPEKDVYRLLIDAFRMHVEDTYVFDGDALIGTIYDGSPHSLHGFRHYMKHVARKPGLLPSWWTLDKQFECEALGMDSRQSNWHDLSAAVEKQDIIHHYGDARFPMQLRMFTEAVYGRGPGGSDGSALRAALMAMEAGDNELSMLTIDTRTGNAAPLSS